MWHFAHRSREDCDAWSEPESEWHRWWKQQALPHQCEVTIGNHRADILSASGKRVIELQHSPISVEEIQERERFYRQERAMIWIFDIRDCEERISLRRSKFRENEVFGVWKWARKSIQHAKAPVYMDLYGDDEPLLRLIKWMPQKESLPQAFVARWIDREDFVYRFIQKTYAAHSSEAVAS